MDQTQTNFLKACRDGDLPKVKEYLENGVNFNEIEDTFGYNPLLWASRQGNINIVELLLDCGSDIEFKDIGVTPLITSSASGYFKLVKMLLDRGANVNSKDVSGLTSLFYASKYDRIDIVELLLERGATTEIKNSKGETFMDYLDDKNKEEIILTLEYIHNRKYIKPAKQM